MTASKRMAAGALYTKWCHLHAIGIVGPGKLIFPLGDSVTTFASLSREVGQKKLPCFVPARAAHHANPTQHGCSDYWGIWDERAE